LDKSTVPVMTFGDNHDGTALKQTTVFTSACALNLYLDHASHFARTSTAPQPEWKSQGGTIYGEVPHNLKAIVEETFPGG